jgi:hypothetical protein
MIVCLLRLKRKENRHSADFISFRQANLQNKKINMKKINLKTIVLPMLFTAITLSSCKAIAGIFKAGVWFGVIGVVVIIVIIFWLISRAGKK